MLRIGVRRERRRRPATRSARCRRRHGLLRAELLRLRQHVRPRCPVARRARDAAMGTRRRHRVAERQRRGQPHVPATRAAARHDHLGGQPGQRRHGGLRRSLPRRPADHGDRAVPRSRARPAALCDRRHQSPRAGGAHRGAADRAFGRRRSNRHVAHRIDVGQGCSLRRTVRPLRRGHRDDPRRDARDAEAARQRWASPRHQHRVDELLGRRGLAGRRSRRARTTAIRAVHRRAPAAHRVDFDRTGHRQQSVRLPHVHVGRPPGACPVLHRSHGRAAGRDHVGARRATEPRQRPVVVDRRRRRTGRCCRRDRQPCRDRGDDGRMPQRIGAGAHRAARDHAAARAHRGPGRGARRGDRRHPVRCTACAGCRSE